MDRGKKANFSVIKEKIIKTDEILRMYLETTNKLKKAQHICKEIKLKYDQTALNLTRFQLENERCTFNLENMKWSYDQLEKENKELREQTRLVEEKYNQQTIQSQLEIKRLEDELKMLEEINTAASHLSKKKNSDSETEKKIKQLEEQFEQLKDTEANSKKEIVKLSLENKKLSTDVIVTENKYSEDIKKLETENNNLLCELNRLKYQLIKFESNAEKAKEQESALLNLKETKNIEINEIQDEIHSLVADNDKLENIEEENESLNMQLLSQEINTTNIKESKSTVDIHVQTDTLPMPAIHTRTLHIQTSETMTTLHLQESLHTENQLLKQSLLDYEAQIFKLKTTPKIITRSCSIQTEVPESAMSVDDILKEMCVPIPKMLSPMRPNSYDIINFESIGTPTSVDNNSTLSASLNLTNIPNIIVTPPTPILEKSTKDFNDFHITEETELHDQHNKDQLMNREDLAKSFDSATDKISDLKNNPRKKKYRSSHIGSDIIKLRKGYVKFPIFLNKPCILGRGRRKTSRIKKQDCILEALQTLKRSKINFTISNESILSRCCADNDGSINNPVAVSKCNLSRICNPMTRKFEPVHKYKSINYITEKLNCDSKYCIHGKRCMLLSKMENTTELLGFFNVKNEIITPASSRLENILDNKSSKLFDPGPLAASKVTTENLLETLAELVSQKLRQKSDRLSKNRRLSILDGSASFNSETETEIERLFEKPTCDILKRNKMLLRKAEQSNQCCTSTTSLEERDIDEEKNIFTNNQAFVENPPEIMAPAVPQACNQIIENEKSPSLSNCEPDVILQTINKDSCNSCKHCSNLNSYGNLIKQLKSTSVKPIKRSLWPAQEGEKNKVCFNQNMENCATLQIVAENSEFPSTHNINENSESCDPLKFTCPELLSPLSSITSKDGCGRKSVINLFQENDTLEANGKTMMEISPVKSVCNVEHSELSSNVRISPLTSSEKIGSFLFDMSTSTVINKYLHNEGICTDLDTFLDNFEEDRCVTEGQKESTPNKQPNEDKIEKIDEDKLPIESKTKVNLTGNIALEQDPVISKEGSQKMQDEKCFSGAEDNTSSGKNVHTSLNENFFPTKCYTEDLLDNIKPSYLSKEKGSNNISNPVTEENKPTEDTKQLSVVSAEMNVLPWKEIKLLEANEVKDIPSCSKLPIYNYPQKEDTTLKLFSTETSDRKSGFDFDNASYTLGVSICPASIKSERQLSNGCEEKLETTSLEPYNLNYNKQDETMKGDDNTNFTNLTGTETSTEQCSDEQDILNVKSVYATTVKGGKSQFTIADNDSMKQSIGQVITEFMLDKENNLENLAVPTQEVPYNSTECVTTQILTMLSNKESNLLDNNVSENNLEETGSPKSPSYDYDEKLATTGLKIIPLERLGTESTRDCFDQPDNSRDVSVCPEPQIESFVNIEVSQNDRKQNLETISCTDSSNKKCIVRQLSGETKISLNSPKEVDLTSAKIVNDTASIIDTKVTSPKSPVHNHNNEIKVIHQKIIPLEKFSNEDFGEINYVRNPPLNDEIANELNCPQSPINNHSDEIYLTPPKIIPLEKLNNEHIINDFSERKIKDTQELTDDTRIETCNIKSVPPDNDRCKYTTNENCQATKIVEQNSPTNTSSVLRRSQRTRKISKYYSEFLCENDMIERMRNIIRNKLVGSPTTESLNETLKEKCKNTLTEIAHTSQSSDFSSSNLLDSDKRKRGCPRKDLVVKIKNMKVDEQTNHLEVDDINSNKEISELNRVNTSENTLKNKRQESTQVMIKKKIYVLTTYNREKPLEKHITLNFHVDRENTETESNITICKNTKDGTSETSVIDLQGQTRIQDTLLISEDNSEELNIDSKRKVNCGVAKKRKPRSRLESNILKQIKMKRKMFQTNAEIAQIVNSIGACDSKSNNLNNPNATTKEAVTNINSSYKSDTNRDFSKIYDDRCSDKKIHVVQNIMIPPNSNYTVDLLEKKEDIKTCCDVRLEVSQNSHQSDSCVKKPSSLAKKRESSTSDDSFVKKKRIKPRNSTTVLKEDSDVLSRIMSEMDKDRPDFVVNSESKPNKLKEEVPVNITDKEWRKGIIKVAESTCNVSSGEGSLESVTNKQNLVQKAKDLQTKKIKILMSRLSQLSTEERIADEVILEFKRQEVDNIAEIILHKVSQDIYDKPDDKYYPAPLMTKTQRTLLSLMVRLESENINSLMDTFLTKAEIFLFKVGCGIRAVAPITRLYMAVCRLRANISKMRTFCCYAFLFMGDLAIPLLFTVLTSWTEVLPMESDLKNYPMAKVLVHIVHLKSCNKPGYNLFPLKGLLSQFYGYPRERWDCDEMFEELFQFYLKHPVNCSDLALCLLCKNKDTKWVYKKVNEFLKPLVYKIPEENQNFKSTVIILIGKICRQFKPNNELDETYLNDLRRWLMGLTEEKETPDLITKSVHFSLSVLPKKKGTKLKKNKGCKKKGKILNNKKCFQMFKKKT